MSSKKNKNKNAVEPVDTTEDSISVDELSADEAAVDGVAADEDENEEETPKLSREEAKNLFATYREVNSELSDIEARIVSLNAQRSNVLKAIHDGVGKGPFKFDGATVTIMTRTAKEEGSETAYFFKRLGAAIQDFDD